MKIYVAAPWARREDAKAAREKLVAAGHVVTSRWLDFPDDAGKSGLEVKLEVLQTEALNDIEDVLDCEILLLLNLQKRGEETSGKAVETGIALATMKGIVIVGEPTNVFHYLPFPKVATVDEAVELINAAVEGHNDKAATVTTDN